MDAPERGGLRLFAEEVYLRQVVERGESGFERHTDLPQAIDAWRPYDPPREWRIHYHVPVFREALGPFSSTQPFLREILGCHRAAPVSSHIEVETYTWEVTSEAARAEASGDDLVAMLAQEMEWTAERLEGK